MSRDNSEFESVKAADGVSGVPGIKATKQPSAPEPTGGTGQVPPPQQVLASESAGGWGPRSGFQDRVAPAETSPAIVAGAAIAAVAVVIAICIPRGQFAQASGGTGQPSTSSQTQSSNSGTSSSGSSATSSNSGTSSGGSSATSSSGTSSSGTSAKEAQPTVETTTSSSQTSTESKPAAPPSFSSTSASSELPGDEVTAYYGSDNAVDNNFVTAWNEGADGDGIGEWVSINASSPQRVSGVSIVNGYPKTGDIFTKNNRCRNVTIILSDGYEQHVTLADAYREYQTFNFDHAHDTTFVRVRIDSVYKGSAWDDTSICELQAF